MKFINHNLTVFFWIGLLALIGLSAFAYKYYFTGEPEQTACTQEAKLCPDGSYVGRTGPNCEFAKCPGENGGENFRTSGTVYGKVSIGPLCPVEPCNISINPYEGKRLIFTRLEKSMNPAITINLSSDGSYSTELPASNYSVTLSDCKYMGCSYAFPKNVRVEKNKSHELNIDIDTGIR